ncbi:MAG: hypothetical protein GF330_14700 [Candidatus Eisenbacteria bacterium]|nr:hypothetical protein [Candidatus Eisenbacteria bacterium]
MFTKAERLFTSILFVVCAVVGLVGFALSQRSDAPDRIWFDAAGGDVIFDHTYHAALAECSACHHNMEDASEAESAEMSCRRCHYHGEAREVPCEDPHPRCVGANCTDCHDGLGAAMSQCDACHLRAGLAFEASGRELSPPPPQIELETDFGTVPFDHQLHAGEALGLGCADCHHAVPETAAWEDMAHEKNCRACHYDSADQIPACESDGIHERCIGANCTMCHGVDECDLCHQE